MKIKVCGMKQPTNIELVAKMNPDFMGFIFYGRSPRYMPGSVTPEKIRALPRSIIKTGVFVNESVENVLAHAKTYGLEALQFHGDETPDFCGFFYDLGFIVIKAFRVDESFDFNPLDSYQTVCHYYLFDTKSSDYGGTGRKFDWSVLNRYDNQKPIFLSGGIGPDDAEKILNLNHLKIFAIDINSKFETEPGLKNLPLLQTFIEKVRNNK